MSYRIRVRRPKGRRIVVPRFPFSEKTRVRLGGGRELVEMVARKNPAINTVMTVKDVSGSAYKLA